MKKNRLKAPSAKYSDQHHDCEHEQWSRRSFLRNLGIVGSGLLMAGKVPLTAFAAGPLTMGLSESNEDNILVMIRLQGGNDGLNTIIPIYDYGTYQSLRPGIAIAANSGIPLNDELMMHSSLQGLEGLWNNGQMKLINSVGYPDQNLSHFRSSDIWASASDANVEWDAGWLGRYFDEKYPNFVLDPPDIPPAIQIGGAGDMLFTGEMDTNYGINVATPQQLEYIAESGGLHDAEDVPPCLYGNQLSYLRTVTNNTFKYADIISTAYENGENAVDYSGGLGRQLSTIARLIKGNLGTRLYVVTLNGFDTHANQLNQHSNLLLQLSLNINAFYNDLSAGGVDDKVLSFSFSEFGRRPAQNSSQGTDHGAAAPMFLFGTGLGNNGILGALPDLNDLDNNGNLKYDIDFRSVYASVLENWLCIEPGLVDLVLGQSYQRLALGFDCSSVSTYSRPMVKDLQHQVRYDADNRPYLFLDVHRAGQIKVEIFTAMGQSLGEIHNAYHYDDQTNISLAKFGIRANGYYFYKIHHAHRVYSGKFLMR